jgi:type I phosphodiesterase/nucleotide pyrophosphatase
MSRDRKLHIFVLIDALGWKCIEGREFLSDLLPYRMPVRTVLGYSSGAIPSILSGCSPAEHGHWNLYYYNPERSPFRWLRHFLFLPKSVLDNRVSRKLLKELGRRVLGLGPCFECCVSPRILPWFDWVEKRNLYAPGGISGAPSIFDHMEHDGVPYRVYSYREMNDKEILDQARIDILTGRTNVLFLYLSEMDAFLHMHCGDVLKLQKHLEWYESQLRDLFRSAQRFDPEVSFTILSDHGMTLVTRYCDLVQEIDSLGFQMPRDYVAVYDSTMARFWFFDEKARGAIAERLDSLTCGRILSSAQLEQLGVHFQDHRYGELIFLLDPGWLLTRSDFNGHDWSPKGMHGYHPEDPDSDAVLLTNKNPSIAIRSVSDLFYLIEEAASPQ